ncbi:hypothetical protein [Amycolatopsis pigmentata]|uniref:Uncharacterized protein n=1 Tax=Amycolatopsis pigmentata TaxID=450801 RepID=A0ABW5FZ22_9PSEU
MTMVELDDLREILRAREPLAPEPGEVFSGAERRYRRVRTRRRVVGAAAAVVVITAGLSVGLGLARQHGSPAPAPQVQAAAPPSDPLVVPASSLPFTVVKAGDAQLTSWTISERGTLAAYDWGGLEYTVVTSDNDPETGYDTPPTTVSVNGTRASLRWLGNSTTQVSWPLTPGKWVAVSAEVKYVTPDQLLVFADTVRLAPAPVPTLIHSLRVPAGLSVATRRGTASQDTVTLCPTGSGAGAGAIAGSVAGKMPNCVVVTASRGVSVPQRSPTGTTEPSPGRHAVVDGIDLSVSGDGRSVVRQFPGRSLQVMELEGDPSVLPAVAASVVMN